MTSSRTPRQVHRHQRAPGDQGQRNDEDQRSRRVLTVEDGHLDDERAHHEPAQCDRRDRLQQRDQQGHATGQFERTLIIADEGAQVSYLEGCTAPQRDENQLHAAVVVLVVLLGLAVTALVTGLGRPRVQAIEPVPGATILATGTPATTPDSPAPGAESGAVLAVHVAGKVANPGIVQLPPGPRVIDAL